MWFIVALIVGIGVAAIVAWMRSSGVSVKWYEWVVGAVGLLILLFAMQNFLGSGVEGELGPANKYLLVAGLPSLILLAVAGALVWRRHSAAS